MNRYCRTIKKFSQQRLPNLKLSQCQETSLPTTFQQSITSISNNVCINTFPIIYKCKTHANTSTLLKNKSKEQLSPQLISIDSMISLNKMNRKIINFHRSSHLYHLIFISFNMYAQIINDIKNRK